MQKKPDPSIFYSLAVINGGRELAVRDIEWGSFVSVGEEWVGELGFEMPTRVVNFDLVRGLNPFFDSVVDKIYAGQSQLANYHRSSAKYYMECLDLLGQHKGSIQHLVEVGPQAGDLSCFFASMLQDMDITFDLIDINKSTLFTTFKKIKQIYPECLSRVRLFFGDLPAYIKNVASLSPKVNLFHYQASTNFNDVVRDLGATFYIRQKTAGTIIHNPHLRHTDMNHYSFADSALYALFGTGIKFLKLGEEVSEEAQLDGANYYACYRVDGMYIPYA